MKTSIKSWQDAGQALALAVFVILGSLSISEVGARVDFINFIDGEISERGQELAMMLRAERSQKSSDSERSVMENSGDAAKNLSISTDPNLPQMSGGQPVGTGALTPRMSLEYVIEIMAAARTKAKKLIFEGGRDDRITLGDIMSVTYGAEPIGFANLRLSARLRKDRDLIDFGSNIIGIRFDLFSSNVLLALLVSSCGAIGALTAGLRTANFTTFRDICLGLGTGFICYLFIRSGSDGYSANQKSSLMMTNPYSASLTAILAGLFSEKFYLILTELFDSITDRLVAGFGNRKPAGQDSDNAPKKTEP